MDQIESGHTSAYVSYLFQHGLCYAVWVLVYFPTEAPSGVQDITKRLSNGISRISDACRSIQKN